MNGCIGNTSVTNLLWCKTSCHHREPAPYAWQASRCQPILGLSVCQTWKINYQPTWGINWLGRFLKQHKARGKTGFIQHVCIMSCVFITMWVPVSKRSWQLHICSRAVSHSNVTALLFVSKIWTQLSAGPCVVFTATNLVSSEISPVLSSHVNENLFLVIT